MLARTAPDATDALHPPAPPPDNLLGWLKNDLAADRMPTEPPVLDPADRCVQVHACHGRTRQVEVLREVIVGLLADDPTLEPRDVLVMCPDVETFAPIIAATFALGSKMTARIRRAGCESGSRTARYGRPTRSRCARAAARPGYGAASPPRRCSTSPANPLSVGGLASATRRSNGFGTGRSAPVCVGAWTAIIVVAGGWTSLEQGTWRAGLDRLLLGAAMEGVAAVYGEVVPLDDVDSCRHRPGRPVRGAGRPGRCRAGTHVRSAPPGQWMAGLEQAVLGIAAMTP